MWNEKGLYSFELFKFHDFFNDLFKFSKTLGFTVVTFKNFQQTQTLGSTKMGAVCTV